jgi:hypothetical protein
VAGLFDDEPAALAAASALAGAGHPRAVAAGPAREEAVVAA